ncbi:hypothetical protein RchiOBHm_Chr2g0140941 [Rosa chinensis]|uniref:Uncharacterized protein n=1 Tax=Rosa chinensis TaxID=74649 RepID=A0A2P6RXF5_ROSCH|nr:hypothetical protein RchiOBHm_Chr2g0140941 [Rosa chinensis]
MMLQFCSLCFACSVDSSNRETDRIDPNENGYVCAWFQTRNVTNPNRKQLMRFRFGSCIFFFQTRKVPGLF